MSYQFEGKTYATQADWIRDYPLYRAHVEDLKAGATSIMDIEKAKASRLRVARIKSREAAQRQNRMGQDASRRIKPFGKGT